MSRPVFHVAQPQLVDAQRVVVDGPEGRHAAVVRRTRVGEEVVLTDGQGLVVDGIVREVDRSSIAVDVVERHQQPKPQPTLVVVQALPKGDRGELAVELLTEIGVDVIVPWSAGRCVARWEGNRGARGVTRWRNAAREAAKQSRRTWWPQVEGLATTEEIVNRIARAEQAFVLNEQATTSLAAMFRTTRGDESSEIVLVVGPEGGLTDDETRHFVDAGAKSVLVGPHVLRTSTAGLVAATVILAGSPRWSTP